MFNFPMLPAGSLVGQFPPPDIFAACHLCRLQPPPKGSAEVAVNQTLETDPFIKIQNYPSQVVLPFI